MHMGIWIDALPHSLLWGAKERLSKASGAKAQFPTWSWASTVGSVFGPPARKWSQATCTDVVRHDTLPHALSAKGLLRRAAEVEGPFARTLWDNNKLEEINWLPYSRDCEEPARYLLLQDKKRIGFLSFDYYNDNPPPPAEAMWWCLALFRDDDESLICGLILSPCGGTGGDGRYERVGHFSLLDVSWFEGVEAQEITLV
jgi:hypothetical protein